MSTTSLFVLSYNICLEAMTHNVNGTLQGGSAEALGKRCTVVDQQTGLTCCAQNMAHAIDAMPAAMGVSGFSLVGFQEASRARLLHQGAASLAPLTMVHSKPYRSEMVSFYDPSLFTLKKKFLGAFSDHSGDRPFQILVLDDISGSGGVIFINVHCPHGRSENTRHPGHQYGSLDTVALDLSAAAATMSLTAQEAQYRIIAVGDFNEAGWDWGKQVLSAPSWAPLAGAQIPTTIAIKSTPRTCCQPDGRWAAGPHDTPLQGHPNVRAGNRGGDYIFDSRAPADAQVPSHYDPVPPKSDHLPVVAVI